MRKEQYGWVICATCALLLFCTGGLSTTGFSVYQPYLISVRHLTNTQASAVTMFRTMFGLVGMLTVSPLVRKFEVRRIVSFAMVVCGFAFFCFSLSNTFITCCISASIMGLAYGIGGMIPVSILITRWFNGHRGLALGICMAATGLSAAIASPVITFLIQKYSLKTSFIAEAIFILVTAVAVYTILRSNPSCLDTKPIGSGTVSETNNYARHSAPHELYALMLVGIILFGAPANNINTHLSVHFQSVGYKAEQISLLISVFGIALAVGKCGYGQVADLIGTYKASWILYGFVAIGTTLCCLAKNGNFAVALAAVILVGIGLAVTSVSISMYASKIATKAEYAKVVSSFQIVSTLGSLIFSTVPGMLADITDGTYVIAYEVMLVLVIVSACLMQLGYHLITERDAGSVRI